MDRNKAINNRLNVSRINHKRLKSGDTTVRNNIMLLICFQKLKSHKIDGDKVSLRPKNRYVSTNPIDPTFWADLANFFSHFEKKIRGFSHLHILT